LENLKIIGTSAVVILERNYYEKCDDLDKGRTVMDVKIKLKDSLPCSYNPDLNKPG
jgi:hypothetical protein